MGGKQAWLAAGLRTEGTGPHLALAGEVLVPTTSVCGLDATSGDIRSALGETAGATCAVTNDRGVLLGRVRRRDLPEGDDVPVDRFMQPGPATVRTIEELEPLVGRMRHAGVTTILVSDAEGRLLGMLRRSEAEQLLADRRLPADGGDDA